MKYKNIAIMLVSNMNKFKLLVFPFLIFLFLAFTSYSYGVYFATNKMILYEFGRRIKDSSVIHNRSSQTPVCKKGICEVGQQYDSVTFYKTSETNVLNYDEWIDSWYSTHEGCEDFATKKEEIRKALEEWRYSEEYLETQKKVNQTTDVNERKRLWEELEPKRAAFMKEKGFDFYDKQECQDINLSDYENIYLKNLKDTAFFLKTISLPPPEGGEECKGEMCIGGRIGNDRTLEIDIKEETIEIRKETNIFSNFIKTIICFIRGIFGKSC